MVIALYSHANALQQVRVDGDCAFGHHAQVSLGYFNTWGSADAAFYATTPGAVDNRASGNPGSAGCITELDYLPGDNTKSLLQYGA